LGRLDGKVALITGAGSGIGRASALLFAKEGCKVVVVDVVEEAGKETVSMIKESGGDAIFLKADVSKAFDSKRVMKATVAKYGKLDILFNNAGINPSGTVVDTPEKVWDRVININLKGVFLFSKYAIPEMAKGGGGVIVNTASVSGLVGTANEIAYVASKGGVVMMTKAMAIDHAHQNIRVNCICPAGTETALLGKWLATVKEPEKVRQELTSMSLLKRLAKPEEIAYTALFLVSDESSFMTGSAVAVDGGFTAW
jgi:meso-butanediol dehydrogenase/(S,S)-butanediol dehydrogenase/diacetyl reductase